jgi:hypothetical protein
MYKPQAPNNKQHNKQHRRNKVVTFRKQVKEEAYERIRLSHAPKTILAYIILKSQYIQAL